ncbi:hypothetical protein ACS0TY_006966 [Phlomoides rotata]
MSASSSAKQAKARDLKHRVLTCLHKLSDRDTHSAAALELESIAKTLSAEALPPFLSSIAATDSSDKSPVRRQCLRLIYVLSEHHGNCLSPYLSKLLSAVVRRLRDPDSSVRSACVAASLSLSSNLSSPFTSIIKPFVESLFTEQDFHAQTGAALCLAAVIEGSRNPDAGSLRRLLPRIEKLAKCESFKAKPALLALMGSVVGVKGVLSSGGKNVVGNLICCLMEFLSSEDWAARKAAAEALMKIATVEKESLSEYKTSCLKTFESKRFDKVKAARETMNQMIEAWKEISDLHEEFSPLPESEASSKENASDGRFPPGSRSSIGSTTPQVRKKSLLDTSVSWAPFSDGSPASTARKRNPCGVNGKKTGPGMFQKLDRKKPSEVKVEIVTPTNCYGMAISDDKDEQVSATSKRYTQSFEKSGIKRALFNENNGKQKLGLFKGGSRVVPCGDTSVVVSNETGDICRSQRESEDLSLIRKQLVQIENQQSNLLDLLQKFIGSTQKGMHSLETRVHGLELSLDEISFDLAVSTRRMSQNGAAGAMCCKLPGTEFLSSKLWGKLRNRSSISRLPASGGTPSMANKFGDGEGFPMENQRFLQGGRGLIVNPLAKFSSGSLGFPEVSSSGAVNNSAA